MNLFSFFVGMFGSFPGMMLVVLFDRDHRFNQRACLAGCLTSGIIAVLVFAILLLRLRSI